MRHAVVPAPHLAASKRGQDECRQAFGLRLLDELRGDVVYALRLLRRSPAFTAVALLSLGLGVGANTAIFSLIDTVLLKSLPVTEPERLFFVDDTGGRSGGGNYAAISVLRAAAGSQSVPRPALPPSAENLFKVTIDGVPEQIRGQTPRATTSNCSACVPRYGRLFTPADDSIIGRGGPDGAVAVISYALWERRFGLDLRVLGKTVQVGTDWVTIVGVTEPRVLRAAGGIADRHHDPDDAGRRRICARRRPGG